MEGNRIVSLQSDRNPLQEEAGFVRIARSGPVSRPPRSVKKLTPSAFIGPGVSIAMATKSGDCLTPVYLAIFLSDASSAAAPLTADVLGKCEGASSVRHRYIPCNGFAVLPRYERASVHTLLAAIAVQPSGFLL